jgi:toxin ParE1/3/4
MKAYHIEISTNAENDLMEIWSYIAETDLIGNANNLTAKLEKLCQSLFQFPERGRIVPEMRKLGVTEFREIQHNPYRIIYNIWKEKVLIVSVVDGRRALEVLLKEKLLDIRTSPQYQRHLDTVSDDG